MTLPPLTPLTRHLALLPLHLAACVALAVAADALLAGGAVTSLLLDSDTRGLTFRLGGAEILGHLGCASMLWASLVGAWTWQRRRAQTRVLTPVKVLPKRGGAVLLETLIVVAPFLALTGGLMQLSINSIAGLLANLGTYQAARTVWVWLPEARGDRAEPPVSEEKVVEMARLAAASALAPVVPSALRSSYATNTNEVVQMRAAMFAHFQAGAQAPYGSTVAGQVNAGLGGGIEGDDKGRELTVALAFDAENMGNRAVRKLTFAAHPQVTKIRLLESTQGVGVSLTYHHYQAFPWFGYLLGLGNNANIDGRQGYYLPITRSYTLPPQVPPT